MNPRLPFWSLLAALGLGSLLSGCVYGGYRHDDDRYRARHEEHEEHEEREHGGDNY